MAPRPKHTTQIAAFTLLEMLVYITILAIITSMITSLVLVVYRYKTIVEDRVNVNEDMRVLVKSIRDDMYFGRSVLVDTNGVLVITTPGDNEIRYYLTGTRVFRQQNVEPAIAMNGNDTNIISFTVQDISTPEAAGTVQIFLDISNYPAGQIKPEIRETITSTISLKYI